MASPKLKRRLAQMLPSLALVLTALWAQVTDYPLVLQVNQRLDALMYDLRLRFSLEQKEPDPRVVIVDIDEESLQAVGRWPWPRDRLAVLLENLFEANAALVAFDIVFAEGEPNSAARVFRKLEQRDLLSAGRTDRLDALLPAFDNDRKLAEAMSLGDVVLGYLFKNQDDAPIGQLPPPMALREPIDLEGSTLPKAASYTGNIDRLQDTAGSAGFFSFEPGFDGIIRRTPLLQVYKGEVYPSLALEVVRKYLFVEKIGLDAADVGGRTVVEGIRLANIQVETDSHGSAVVPFRGPWGSFRYVSAADVINGDFRAEHLEGAIVLVGTTAQGLFDLRAVPIQAVYPGVEIHANLISGMLDNQIPYEPSWSAGAGFVLTTVLGLALTLLLPFISPVLLVAVVLGVLAALFGSNYWLWAKHGLVLHFAPQYLLILSLAGWNFAYGFLIESRSRRQLKQMFGQYVPKDLVEQMSQDPRRYGFQGESRELTVLFSDIRGFTTLSEGLGAERLKQLLNRFFTPMTRVIFEHRGTIDKYVGDMIMAFWGAPVEDDQHAYRAVQAALRMQEESARVSAEFIREGLPEVRIGIGLNTGVMDVGDMGSEYRRSYTVLGDAVNLGSRLEGASKFYGVGVVVGERTWELTRDRIVYRELDLLRVKGKSAAVRAFEPVGEQGRVDDQLLQRLERYHEALVLYRERRWEEAGELFRTLQEEEPDRVVYGIYLERIAALIASPPGSDWDGVFERTTK